MNEAGYLIDYSTFIACEYILIVLFECFHSFYDEIIYVVLYSHRLDHSADQGHWISCCTKSLPKLDKN